jgi:hypothetical protein
MRRSSLFVVLHGRGRCERKAIAAADRKPNAHGDE